MITEQLDCFGNHATYFTVEEPHDQLTVRASSQIEVLPTTPPDGATSLPWERACEFLQGDRSPRGLEAYQFVFDSPYVKAAPELVRYAAPFFTPGRPLLEAALDLMHRIYADFSYDPTATTITTPLREVLDQRRGVCQDFAHLEIGCLRSLGLAARYVSGYLRTEPPPGQPRLVGVDASHAWLSVYCPPVGWVGLDPTNDQVPSDKHYPGGLGLRLRRRQSDQGRKPRRRPAFRDRGRGRRPGGQSRTGNRPELKPRRRGESDA